MAENPKEIRESVIAGSWYPGNPETLKEEIKRYLNQARQEVREPLALIVPHAGYIYSGGVAAFAYKQIEGKSFQTVVIIGPSHRAYFRGFAIYDRGFWRTPLGLVEIDSMLAKEIIAQNPKEIQALPQVHRDEHSLEIQLPFLQVVLDNFKIVPIMMNEQDLASCRLLASALVKSLAEKNILLLASSDLSHYHPYNQALKLDQVVIEAIQKFDPEGLSESLQKGLCEACGGGPIVTVMLTAKGLGAEKAKILKYANSGDVTGDKSGVVGYLAAGIYRVGNKSQNLENESRKKKNELTEIEKKELLRIARTSIETAVRGKPIPKFQATTSILSEKRGVFVTLHEHGELRGCIGYIEGIKPLYEAVSEMAVAAATQDFRFSPVKGEELSKIDLEISVLTPLKKIEDIDEIVLGRDGVVVRRSGRSGVFLPQVATETGWDKEEFLSHLCYDKAGLPPDAWKDSKTEIFVFSAEVFSEK
ncbi:MAG: AmmeMemoRadiSam system protein B [Candidatus Edwardsbacteria bacterium]